MSNQSRIAVLCNNRMAIPAIQALHGMANLCALGVPENNTDVLDFCKALSAQAGIPLILLRKENLTQQLKDGIQKLSPDFVFTMTFPWKIPDIIWQNNPGKCYNFHYGLLPEMRGTDPVFESIRQQKKETGLTVHAIESGIDTGAIILKQILPIEPNMTHGLLCTQLSYLGARILPQLIKLLQSNITATPQDERIACYYPRPNPSDVCIRWEMQNAAAIYALVRACNPWNKGAYTQWKGWHLRILEVSIIDTLSTEDNIPGTILSADATHGLIVQCKDKTQLKLDIIYTDEGFMTGHRLTSFGIKKGDILINL